MMRIVQVGLGPLGQQAVRYALERGVAVVAAADPAPDTRGRDLGEVCGMARTGVVVQPSIADAIRDVRADAAVVMTVSGLAAFEPQAAELARARLPVVSTCEELSFPWATKPDIARRLDRAFADGGVACLGTGVNPGYLMDFLPSVLTGVCRRVDAVRVWRVQDASARRVPFQQKIGAGLSLDDFRRKEREGTLRHVGLSESLDFIAARLGWALDRKTQSLNPVIAERDVCTGYRPIVQGMARGVEQVGRGYAGGVEVITLHFRAAVGEPESYDRVRIEGEPPIESTIAGGVNGDVATCSLVLNALPLILKAAPGLRTMADIPAPSWWRRKS